MNLLDDNYTENEEALNHLIIEKASKLIRENKTELFKMLKQEFIFCKNKPVTGDVLLKVIEKWARKGFI